MAATNTQIQQSTDTLRAMGMSATQIEAIGKTRQRTYTVEIRSPAAGFVSAARSRRASASSRATSCT